MATIADFVFDRAVAVADRSFAVAASRVEAGRVLSVSAASPGIKTVLDLPITIGRHAIFTA